MYSPCLIVCWKMYSYVLTLMMMVVVMKMKMMKAPSYDMLAIFLVFSAHPCVCGLYGKRIQTELYSYCSFGRSAGVFYECGEPAGRCICKDNTAYCSQSSPALPVLPDDIYVLDLCNDYFVPRPKEDVVPLPPQFFSHLNNVTELRIRQSQNLGPIELLNWCPISQRFMYRGGIWTNTEVMKSVYRHLFSMPTLTSFTSSWCGWIPPSSHLGPRSRLQSFSASCSGSMDTLDLGVFSSFKDLKSISVIFCSFREAHSVLLPALEELILDYNGLTSFPQTCDMNNNSFFPSLNRLSLKSILISQLGANGSSICLPQLTELMLDDTSLTSFPQTCDMHNNSLFPSLKTLSLKSNHINQIGGDGSAICLPQLTELILYINSLTSFPQTCDVHNNSLFPSLKTLSLWSRYTNQIGGNGSAICLPRLTDLNLNRNDLTSFPQTCDMHNNSLFPSLKTLSLTYNHINQIGGNGSAICLPRLTDLNLNANVLTSFPQTCDTRNSSLFPLLKRVSLVGNYISQIGGSGSVACLPQVTDIDLSGNPITSIQKGVFDTQNCPRLETINFSWSFQGYIFTEDYVFANPSIKSLVLISSGRRFADCTPDNCVAPNTFANSRVTHLTLDKNDFSGVSSARFVELFGSLRTLVHLSLRDCSIDVKYLSTDMFGPNLQYLDLSHNKISTLASQPLPPMLTTLYLHKNALSSVPQRLIDLYQPIRLTTFTLYGNPLTCSCDNRWLQTLLRSHPHLFDYLDAYLFEYLHPDLFDYPDPDLCVDDQNKNSSLFNIREQPCLLGKEASIAVIVICCLIICPMTLVPLLTILSRYRWHVRLLLHYALNVQRDDRPQPNYVYDVFVSYDQDDHKWVRQHLMPELEERLGLRLCVHERDFIPGHYIVTNIVQAVEHSKRVLIVFSKNFVLSHWCQFEMDYCLSHVIQKGNSLLMVCLDHVSSTDPELLTGSMKAALTTMTYIQWKDRPDAVHSFWGRIRVALRDVIPRQQPQRPHDPLDPDARVNIEMLLMDF